MCVCVCVSGQRGHRSKHKATDEMQIYLNFFSLTSPAGASPKQHLGMAHSLGHTHHGACSMPKGGWTCCFLMASRDSQKQCVNSFNHWALIFPTAGQESGKVDSVSKYHRPTLAKRKCSACQAHKTKVLLVRRICFSTPICKSLEHVCYNPHHSSPVFSQCASILLI